MGEKYFIFTRNYGEWTERPSKNSKQEVIKFLNEEGESNPDNVIVIKGNLVELEGEIKIKNVNTPPEQQLLLENK